MASLMKPIYHRCKLVLLALVLLFNLHTPILIEAQSVKSARLYPHVASAADASGRERISINAGWRFARFTSNPDSLSYDILKQYILPAANNFITGTKRRRPSGIPPVANYAQASFDDSTWTELSLPHDWAIKGPFGAPGVGGGMGRLPSNGIGWYRKNLTFTNEDTKRSVFLDVDGALSYAAVWLNGNLVGGWPFGYASWRLDLTPYLKVGSNVLAIRLDNPLEVSRWYPGGGIYRNVWLVKVNPVHVAQYGTYITTPTVSTQSAGVNLTVTVENSGTTDSGKIQVITTVHPLDATTGQAGPEVATFPNTTATVAVGSKQSVTGTVTIPNPLLWGPPPAQNPNLYIARTTILSANNTPIDSYTTHFGIRSLTYDADKGLLVNGRHVRVQGVCNHHDLGSLGAAFNTRAAERQLEMLAEMGANALRTSHNPPAPELLDLADRMGILVMDEIFDSWAARKTTNDFHLVFADWSEPDLRSFLRRDRNHPSVISWSIGNEVGEQASGATGGTIAQHLKAIVRAEDPTRQITSGMNSATPGSAVADAMDIIGLNYQGEGLGVSRGAPTWPAFRRAYPDRMLWSTESSSAVSTRGTYIFPVTPNNSATVDTGSGGDPTNMYVSDYGLYATSWGSSPDKVFEQQDRNSYVAGEFVWTGWDYLGEPTPYNSARSSYFGIIDLAGFKKDRFWIYQARWNPDIRMAHILPHWSFGSDRVGKVTPVHVFSSGDEAELFVNGKSQGRVKRGQYVYRFRWDKVVYEPGEIKAVVYKGGEVWAEETRKTVGEPVGLKLTTDRNGTAIKGDGVDLAFVTVAVVDEDGQTVPTASHEVKWKVVDGPGEIVSTDNGDPTDMTGFPSLTRKLFGGLGLAIVKSRPGATGEIRIAAEAGGLRVGEVMVQVK